jgi:hypothetical protein
MNNLTLANKYKLSPDLDCQDIYIGRPFILGNPYSMKTEGDRLSVIEQYRQWLWSQIQLKDKVYQELIKIALLVLTGKKVRLVCYCSPKPCHGDVIIKAVDWLITSGKYKESNIAMSIQYNGDGIITKTEFFEWGKGDLEYVQY